MSELERLIWMRSIVYQGQAAAIRKSAGVTQDDVARAVGCTAGAISLYESGQRRPTGIRARRYADALARMQRGAL